MALRQPEATSGAKINECVLPFLIACANEQQLQILDELDKVLAACGDVDRSADCVCLQIAVASPSLGVKARTLACIADVLGSLAGNNGLRSGPGRNAKFMVGLACFEKEQYNEGIQLLALCV